MTTNPGHADLRFLGCLRIHIYCWGLQLIRRVREMRETRAAPVTAPATRLRKSTNVVEVPTRAEDFIDPLGLG